MRWHLVDKITKIVPWKKALGVKVVSFEEYSLKKRWGEKGALPQSLLIESVLQLGAWLIIYSSDFKIQPFIVKIGKIDFKDNAVMGQILDLEVSIDSRNENGVIMSGRVFSKGKLIVEGQEAIGVFGDLGLYQKTGAVKSLFNHLYKK